MVLFPAEIDVFVNPSRHDQHNASAVPHHQTESDQNDAIEELEKIVGGLIGLSGGTPQTFFIMEADDGNRYRITLVMVEGQPQFNINPTPEP